MWMRDFYPRVSDVNLFYLSIISTVDNVMALLIVSRLNFLFSDTSVIIAHALFLVVLSGGMSLYLI
jgi:hypothetical protein